MYMRKHNSEPGYGHNVFQTTIAPIIALVGMGYVMFLVLSNFTLLTGYESLPINLLLGGLMVIVGVIGFVVAANLDKKGKLADPQSIDVEDVAEVEKLAEGMEDLEPAQSA